MIEFIKKWWVLGIILIIIILMSIGAISTNILYNKTTKAESELLDIKYKMDTIQESIRQKEFNTIIKYIEIENKEKEKIADEIKKYIKNPNIDLSDKHIQDSISARFYYRFPKDGTSIRPINSLTN